MAKYKVKSVGEQFTREGTTFTKQGQIVELTDEQFARMSSDPDLAVTSAKASDELTTSVTTKNAKGEDETKPFSMGHSDGGPPQYPTDEEKAHFQKLDADRHQVGLTNNPATNPSGQVAAQQAMSNRVQGQSGVPMSGGIAGAPAQGPAVTEYGPDAQAAATHSGIPGAGTHVGAPSGQDGNQQGGGSKSKAPPADKK